MHISILNIFTVFMVLFAVIDITGSIPLLISIKNKTGEIHAGKATLVSLGIMLIFLFLGKPFLSLFGVDIYSFAIAGSLVLLLLGLEMVMGIELFKFESAKGSSVVPIAFPLIAGAGSITTLISLKSQYLMTEIIL